MLETLKRPATKRATAFALLALAITGTGILGTNTDCTWQTRDPQTGQWRDATPQEITGFVDATGELAKTALTATPLTPYLPLVDVAIRLLALFAAWRIVPTTQPSPKEQ